LYQIFAIVLTIVLTMPILHASISFILDNEELYEISETSDEERSGEEENLNDTEEFIAHLYHPVNIDEIEETKSVFFHLQAYYDVSQDLQTPPPKFI